MLMHSCRSEQQSIIPDNNPWTSMLDTSLSQWEKFIGVPHYTVNLPGYPKGDGMNGIPLGLNNDPLGVFTTYTENGEVILKISGEIYGGLTTLKEYDNYHLRMQFKWGNKKYEPRLTLKRDNGLLYHCYGSHGAFWNVWMWSHELQIQETDMGDYIALGPAVNIPARFDSVDNEHAWIYDTTAFVRIFGAGNDGRCRRGINTELAHGEWNTIELICYNDESIHIVNNVVVLRTHNSKRILSNGQYTPHTSGKIQIQSEGAEAYYKNITIRPINNIPEQYR